MSKILFQEKLSFKPQPPIRNAVSLHILKVYKKWRGLKVNNYRSWHRNKIGRKGFSKNINFIQQIIENKFLPVKSYFTAVGCCVIK